MSLDPLRWGIIPYWREDPEQGAPRSLTRLYPLHVNLPMSAWVIIDRDSELCRPTHFRFVPKADVRS